MMSSDAFVICGLLAFIFSTVADRSLAVRSYAALTPSDRLKLADAVAMHQSFVPWFSFVAMLVIIALPYIFPDRFVAGLPLLDTLFIITMFVPFRMLLVRRVSTLAIPDEYVRRFRTQSIIVLIGYVTALLMVAYGITSRVG